MYVPNENLRFLVLGAKPTSHYFGLRVFWKLGYHPSL